MTNNEYNVGILDEVYNRLMTNPNADLSDIKFFHSDVYYTRAAIKAALGIDLTLQQTEDYLREEGMLDDLEDEEVDFIVDSIYHILGKPNPFVTEITHKKQ